MMVGAVETLAYARYRRDDARMNPIERKMAIDGLTESAKSLPSDVVDQINSLSAPVMACFGFALYAIRLGEMESRKRAESREDSAVAAADQLLRDSATSWGGTPAPQNNEVEIVPTANGTYVPTKGSLMNLQEN